MRGPSSILLLLLLLGAAELSIYGQADQGSITGIVTDTQGATVPNAAIHVKNLGTGVVTTVNATSSGSYSTPPLIIGAYEVSAEQPGFKKFVVSGIPLQSGQTYRQDITLTLGDLTQTVNVSSQAEQIDADNAQVSASVNSYYYQNLPAVIGGELRLPESQLITVPGYTPSYGNTVTNYASRINGGQPAASESFLDGASYGEVSGHNYTQERSAPYESIQEMRVIENTFNAQYGHTSGGFIEYTTKTGTSSFHGSAYEYFQNNVLNARGEIASATPIVRQNNFGFTLGGPVWIPKVYGGRKKAFFFINFDDLKFTNPGTGNSFLTEPGVAQQQGNFQGLLGGQVGTDACGRPVYQGEIFNPATTRSASTCGGPAAVSVRDPFPNNVIPVSSQSQVGMRLASFLPVPSNGNLFQNYLQSNDQKYLDPTTELVRLDYSLTENQRLSLTNNHNDRPRYLNCSTLGGCTGAVTQAYLQDITTDTAHLQYTNVIRPNLFTHAVLAYDWWELPDTYIAGGQNYAAKLGLTGIPTSSTGGFPNISLLNGAVPYAGLGARNTYTFQGTDRWQVLDDTTYAFGKHTLKAGFEFRHERWTTGQYPNDAGQFTFSAYNTGAFSNTGSPIAKTGDPFASLLLGQVSSATYNYAASPEYSRNYIAPWINDDYKITNRLTLSFGLRFDLQLARTEKYNRFSSFVPNLPNAAAGGIPGAIAFAGLNGQGNTFEKADDSGIGPRFGFAYRLGAKNVIRGGYGIYYSGVQMNMFAATPDLGYSANPSVTDLTNGRAAAFLLDGGFPRAAALTPPTINPAVGNGTNVLYVNPDGIKLPRYQNWTISVQRQVTQSMLLDVAWVANHGTRLIAGAPLGDLNQNNPAILNQYSASLLTSDIRSPAALAAGISPPYPGFSGTVAQALRPYPQYTDVYPQNSANGHSTYNALQIRLEKNFGNGLQARAAYVWSKLLTNGAEFALSNYGNYGSPQSVYDVQKSLSPDDVPQTFILTYVYELPVGSGKRFLNRGGLGNLLLGGWSISGSQRYESGRPLSIYTNNSLGGILFDTNLTPDRAPNVSGYLNNNNSNFDLQNSHYIDINAFSEPPSNRLGNEPKTDAVLRGFAFYNESLSLYKDFRIREPATLRFGVNSSNLFNRHVWGCFDTNIGDGVNFGKASCQANAPRSIEFYMKFSF